MQLTKLSPSSGLTKVASLPILPVLPTSIDLKPDVYAVLNQATTNSCTANAGTSALELMYNLNKTPIDLSRLFLYWYERQLEGISGDSGAQPVGIGLALSQYGICTEATWPFVVGNVNLAPPAAAVAEAAAYKINSYAQLGLNIKTIKNALAQNIPVLLTMNVHSGFEILTGAWTTHTWNTVTSATNPVMGSHEVLVIGYDDASQRLLLENSWGPTWGDGGFFGMPYDMVDTTVNTNIVSELWVLYPNLNAVITPQPTPIPIPVPAPTSSGSNVSYAVIAAIVIVILILANTNGIFH